ncbi:TPA: hypothetical protein OTQ91_001676 [Klebsiella quasipneumoniae]|jgi:hypothetical protein|uniref:hypothetical protein n=1 Tax=Klebsiella quasipneumoniae TaxID=1463165 RepID=UPI001645BE8E|nr:hypothetical protein [Klebsiella quasipneumoniae]MBC4193467.1 hypothetical protein [Klebsiella pneumoniae]DAZ51756.1 MAG TPA: hypothetical protein [Caudoviricetes sp.]HCT6901540.1 hypothetical protein [Klebsiella aerogenes]HBT3737921.1 hypothetical protein [Klebsiella pneumoniae]HBV4903604.1 hypothetical protein [Klebsiella pneumoniae]
MSSLKLVSTVKFANAKGSEAKYEIYHDAVSNDYQAEVSYLTDVLSTAGFTASVWYKTPLTIYRLPGNTISDLEDSCKDHFESN